MTCNYRAVLQRLSLSSLRMGDGSCLSALSRPQAFLKSEPGAAVTAAASRETARTCSVMITQVWLQASRG